MYPKASRQCPETDTGAYTPCAAVVRYPGYPSASGRHRTVCSEGLREPWHFDRIFHIFGKADAECVFISIVTMYARP